MLVLNIPESEVFDESSAKFIKYPAVNLHMEHSLLALSRWESKWQLPFLELKTKTNEQTYDYLACMTITRGVTADTFKVLQPIHLAKINAYISSSQTATTFQDLRKDRPISKKSSTVTSELIYYTMIQHGIPFECEKWHLNRLMTLIRVCSIKSRDGKGDRMSRRDLSSTIRDLNASRRGALNTRG